MADAIVDHIRPIVSREAALAAGLKRYFTGIPCIKGHIAERNVGRSNECQECKRIRDAAYTISRRAVKAEYDKEYREKNSERVREKNLRYRQQQDHETVRAYQAQYRKDNAIRLRAYREERLLARRQIKRAWDAKNKQHVITYSRAYNSAKMASDVAYRLAAKLRQRLATAVRERSKGGSAVRDLGCSIDELRAHLEAKFLPGMTWGNWGRKGWHIDHIRPLASFDLTDAKQLRAACHYTNLQPLWYRDNLSKGARLDWCAADLKAA